jgi:hypothetical protein
MHGRTTIKISLQCLQEPATYPYSQPDQSFPRPLFRFDIHFKYVLSFRLRIDVPCGFFPSGLSTETLHAPLLSPKRATCPAHLIHLDVVTGIILGVE